MSDSSEKFTFTVSDRHDLTKDEWCRAVRAKHGKYRGAATDEFVHLARLFVDGEIGGEDETDESEIVRTLREELATVRQERDQLREENERLRELLLKAVNSSRATSTAPPSGEPSQTKNGSVVANSRSRSRLEGSSSRADETDERVVWNWEDYDTDEFSDTIPEDALRRIHEVHDPLIGDLGEWEGRELPAINPDHVDAMIGEPADARVALVAAFARYEADTLQTGRLIDIAKTHLDVGTQDYLKNVLVLGRRDAGTAEYCVVDWLAGKHPDPEVDAEWVTELDAYDELLAALETDVRSRLRREVQRFVGAAMGSPAHMLDSVDGSPTVSNMEEAWEERREVAVEQDAIHPVAAKIVSKALSRLEGSSMVAGRLHGVGRSGESWEEFWDDWGTTAEELVEWYEEYRHGSDKIDEGVRDDVISSLEQYEPDELCKPGEDDTVPDGNRGTGQLDAHQRAEPSQNDEDDVGRGTEVQRPKSREMQEKELVKQINDER